MDKRDLLLLLLFVVLLVTKEGKEHVVSDLNSINVKKTLRRRDESKVDSVGGDPYGPRSHNSGFQILGELLLEVSERFAFKSVTWMNTHVRDTLPTKTNK
jgi:hypothetical protein